MKPTRMTVMAALIRNNGWNRGAELGVWQGALFGYLLDTFPGLYLIGVDNWAAVGPYAGKDMPMAEAIARGEQGRHLTHSAILKKSTVEAAQHVPDNSLDFVFIDASHDYESVRADIRAWQSKVRAGGALTGHDADWLGVTRALNEELPGWCNMGANVWCWPVAR